MPVVVDTLLLCTAPVTALAGGKARADAKPLVIYALAASAGAREVKARRFAQHRNTGQAGHRARPSLAGAAG